jgi:hypothetical protein
MPSPADRQTRFQSWLAPEYAVTIGLRDGERWPGSVVGRRGDADRCVGLSYSIGALDQPLGDTTVTKMESHQLLFGKMSWLTQATQ